MGIEIEMEIVVVQLAHLLWAENRTGDLTYRYGGEEFVVVLLGAPLVDGVRRVNARRPLFSNLEVAYGHGSVASTCSPGAVIWQPGESSEALIDRADAKLYETKISGCNWDPRRASGIPICFNPGVCTRMFFGRPSERNGGVYRGHFILMQEPPPCN